MKDLTNIQQAKETGFSHILTLISMLISDKNERRNGTKIQIEQLSIPGSPRTRNENYDKY